METGRQWLEEIKQYNFDEERRVSLEEQQAARDLREKVKDFSEPVKKFQERVSDVQKDIGDVDGRLQGRNSIDIKDLVIMGFRAEIRDKF